MTLRDLENWCAENGASLRQACAYRDGEYHPLREEDNVMAEEVLFEMERNVTL